jgi:hypothetical protein
MLHYNIILPSLSLSSKWSPSFRPPKALHIYLLPNTCHMHGRYSFHRHWFDQLNYLGQDRNLTWTISVTQLAWLARELSGTYGYSCTSHAGIGGDEVQLHSLWNTTSGKLKEVNPHYPLARWAPQPVWMFWRREKSLDPVGNRTSDRPASWVTNTPTGKALWKYKRASKFVQYWNTGLNVANLPYRQSAAVSAQ